MKKIAVPLMFLSTTPAWAQASGSVWDDPMVLFYVTTGFVFVVSLIVVVVALYLLKVIRSITRLEGIERAAKMGVEYQEEPGMFFRLNQWMTRSVPIEKEETILLDHNYDGIRELDNHLPPWWKWLLYGSIIWSAVYLVAYHVTGSLPLSTEEYNDELAYAEEQLKTRQAGKEGPVIDETTVAFVDEPVALSDGQQTFKSICASCHRQDGGGDIGPNLTDDYWLHGGSISDVFLVVKNGVPNTNMVAWGSSLSPEKIQNVASYVLKLKGTNPPNPKAPEGELFTPEPAKVPSDSSKAVQASL
ncbi:MAG: cbb3-type cytochrome c oxidase N-terminal domain-containing protein [Cyclobacteriaceae bacterium]